MTKKLPPNLKDYPPRYCPDCGPEPGYMNVLMFLGVQPDGYVCKKCRGYFDEIDGKLKKLGIVI